MNRLKGQIKSIEVSGKMSIATVAIESGIELKSIVIDTPESATYLKIGKETTALFKETEVMISSDHSPNVSIENQISARISHIEKGSLLSELTLQLGQHQMVAVITTAKVEALKLQSKSDIVAMVKINDIMLSD
ncbi:MAG: TOBE domain-containing protein [Bacteroidota bacterium]